MAVFTGIHNNSRRKEYYNMYWAAFLIIAIFIITPGYLIYQYSQTGLAVFLAIAIGILIFLPGFIKNAMKK